MTAAIVQAGKTRVVHAFDVAASGHAATVREPEGRLPIVNDRKRPGLTVRLAIASVLALGLNLTLAACSTAGFEGIPESAPQPLSDSSPTTTASGAPVPVTDSTVQAEAPAQQQPQQQPSAGSQPPQEVPAAPADPPAVTLSNANGALFTSPQATVSVSVNATSAVGVAYVKATFAGPNGSMPQGAFLSSGTSQTGTWTSTYGVQCNQFRSGGNLTVTVEVGDIAGNVTRLAPTGIGIAYGSVQTPYDPVTNTKSSKPYVCPY